MLENIVLPDVPTLIAVSGWVDSMVLLDRALKTMSLQNIFVAHFHHMLRGEEADRDEDWVKNFCQNNGLHFYTQKRDIASLAKNEKMSIEAAARKYRYMFFAELYTHLSLQSLITAHHRDDKIETGVFNLIRGTRFPGLWTLRSSSFMEINWVCMAINRPFIHISKEAIYHYAQKYSVPFYEDRTNTDETIQRNYIRHNILPSFKEINPNYQKALYEFFEYTIEVQAYLERNAYRWLEEQTSLMCTHATKILPFPEAVYIFHLHQFQLLQYLEQEMIIQIIYREMNHGSLWLSASLVSELLRFILLGNNSHGQKDIKDLHIRKRGERIYIF